MPADSTPREGLREAARFTLDDPRIEPIPESGCWLWTGRLNPGGYGSASSPGFKGSAAHRHVWTRLVGPIPAGLVIDHKCRVRSCVNPDHLRVVTPRVNALENSVSFAAVNASKTHCEHGHPLAGENVQVKVRDHARGRQCRVCKRVHDNDRAEKRKRAWNARSPESRARMDAERAVRREARRAALVQAGVTLPIPNAKKVVCPKCGGPFTVRPNGLRQCSPCKNAKDLAAYYARRKSASLLPTPPSETTPTPTEA